MYSHVNRIPGWGLEDVKSIKHHLYSHRSIWWCNRSGVVGSDTVPSIQLWDSHHKRQSSDYLHFVRLNFGEVTYRPCNTEYTSELKTFLSRLSTRKYGRYHWIDPFAIKVGKKSSNESHTFANVLCGSFKDRGWKEGGSLNLVLEPRQSGRSISKRGIMAHKDRRKDKATHF